MTKKMAVIISLIAIYASIAESQNQALNEDLKWKLPLGEKAKIIQNNIYERHLVEGNYVPGVPIPTDGRPVDHTTMSNTGDMHSSTWTGCYLMGTAFQYGWAKKYGDSNDVKAALDLGGMLLHGLNILTHITGKPGLLVRKIVYGHGPASEERQGSNERNEWHQGVGEYTNFRYRGHPSHHNYHHVLRGLSFWYYFLQNDNPNPTPREKAQMDSVRTILKEMMEYGYKAYDLTLMTVDGRVSTHLIWGIPEGQPSTRALMATNCLKFAYWITGDEWYDKKYKELVERFGYRSAGNWPADKWQGGYGSIHAPDHDDTEHTLGSLWLVYQLEKDPELKAFYNMSVGSIFESKKQDKRSPFNYFYANVTGDLEGADLAGALETLQLYPSITLTYPIMNSIRTDIDKKAPTKQILPFNEQPFDNSYDWKGNPFGLDRWLARSITSLAVSAEDTMVWAFCDESGTLYQSLDGGTTFKVAEFYQNAAVRDITFVGRKSRAILLATDSGIFRTDRGGYRNHWQHVQLGPNGNSARRVMVDTANPNVAWAVMDDGIYRSVDLGLEEIGKAWEPITGSMPKDQEIVYGMSSGSNATFYAAIQGRIYRRAWDEKKWSLSPVDAEDYHIIPTYKQIAVSPENPQNALFVLRLEVWGHEWPLLLQTTDGGKSIKAVGWKLPRPYISSAGSGLEWIGLTSITIDPNNSRLVYGASANGLFRSIDGGINWEQANNSGLRIPYIHRVFAPKETPGKVFVSTPAGLHVSMDKGLTWNQPILVLNGPGINRVDRGGMGYLVGYWIGRYFGYISNEHDEADPDNW